MSANAALASPLPQSLSTIGATARRAEWAAGRASDGDARGCRSIAAACGWARRRPAVDAKRYSGEPISVNLKDVDLKDFFRLIHEISGLNVVLDPSVHGTVTLVLDEVPWDQALDIVLKNNGLRKNSMATCCASSRRIRCGRKPTTTARLWQGPIRRGRAGNRDARSELRQGQRTGGAAQALPVAARRRHGHRPLEYPHHSRHSRLHAGDRQPDPATGPQVAASGNRGSRRAGFAHVRARHRHPVRYRGGITTRTRRMSLAATRSHRRPVPSLVPTAPPLVATAATSSIPFCFRTSRRTRRPAA